MTDSKELIVPIDLSPEKAFAMFTEDKEFDELFASIKAQTDAHEPDLETAKGRDEIKSLAYKVTRTKTFLDNLGKGVKEDAQKTVDAVDAHRRRMKAKLDDLAATVRKPVTEFEEKEKTRIEKLNAALNQVNDLKRIPFDAKATDIEGMIDTLEIVSRETDWQDKAEQAKQSIDDTGQILHTALDAAKTREENARLAAQAEAERQEREARRRKSGKRWQHA